jgi:hypothetical protein
LPAVTVLRLAVSARHLVVVAVAAHPETAAAVMAVPHPAVSALHRVVAALVHQAAVIQAALVHQAAVVLDRQVAAGSVALLEADTAVLRLVEASVRHRVALALLVVSPLAAEYRKPIHWRLRHLFSASLGSCHAAAQALASCLTLAQLLPAVSLSPK